jgi:hypothetical protein
VPNIFAPFAHHHADAIDQPVDVLELAKDILDK